MRFPTAIALMCLAPVSACWSEKVRIVKLEIFSGVHLEVPDDWIIQENGVVIGAAAKLAVQGKAPSAGTVERLMYPAPSPGPAVLNISVELRPDAEAALTRRDFEPAQYNTIAPQLAEAAEGAITKTVLGKTVKARGRATVKAVTVSGVPALRSRAVGADPDGLEVTFEGLYLCAGRAFIAISLLKQFDADDVWAEADQVLASLRIDPALSGVARKPWEPAAPPGANTKAPSAAQKKADGTVWNLFSGLGKKAPPAPAAPDGIIGLWFVDNLVDVGGGKTETHPTVWQISEGSALTIWDARIIKGAISARGGAWAVRSPEHPGDLEHGTYREGRNEDDLITRIAGLPPDDIVWTLVSDKPSRMPACLASSIRGKNAGKGPREAFDALLLGFFEAAYTLNGKRHESLWLVRADGLSLRLDATLQPMTFRKLDERRLQVTSPEGDTLIFDCRLIDANTLEIGLGGETMRMTRSAP